MGYNDDNSKYLPIFILFSDFNNLLNKLYF